MPNIKVRITSQSEEMQAGGLDALQAQQASTDVKRMATASLFVHAAVGNVRQAVQYGLSNVGNFTGDYIAQQRINQTLEVVGDVSSIVMGAVSGGWAGAIIATASVAFKGITKEISRSISYENEEINAYMARQRSGNALMNGSRGTEN